MLGNSLKNTCNKVLPIVEFRLTISNFTVRELQHGYFFMNFAKFLWITFCRTASSICYQKVCEYFFKWNSVTDLFPTQIERKVTCLKEKFLKTHYLTYNAIIFGLKTFFSIIKLIFEGKVSFIYSVITQFSKIALIKVPSASKMPEFVSVSLNTPQYSRTLLNIPKYPWICLKMLK